jgi:hypothetical protein
LYLDRAFSSHIIGDIWFVGQQYNRVPSRNTRDSLQQIVCTFEDIVYAGEPYAAAISLQ